MPAPADVLTRVGGAHGALGRAVRARGSSSYRDEPPAGVMPTNPGQAQFGIVQGGTSPELRARSAETDDRDRLRGLCHRRAERWRDRRRDVHGPSRSTAPLLPDDRPRYLMGVGTPLDLVEAVARGIDMFDCVMPTRNARNGQLFTSEGPINIKNARFADDDQPADPACRLLHLPARFHAPIYAIFSSPARSWEAPLTRCIISTFTLTP